MKPIEDCFIMALGKKVTMHVLPEIGDGGGATYSDETAMGRSAPIKTFANSDNRSISWDITFITTDNATMRQNIQDMFFIESLRLPIARREGIFTTPPPIATLKCGRLLTADGSNVCAILKSYSVKFDTSVPWNTEGNPQNSYWPSKVILSTQWEAIDACANLPTQNSKIFKLS
jgi:hypothetical protein